MKRRTIVTMVGTCILLGTLGIVWKHSTAGDTNDRYIAVTVDRHNILQYASTSGTLNPVKLINIGTQISGVVSKLNVDFNSKVKPGQILAQLDPSLLEAQLAQNKAELVNAQSTFKLASADYKRQKSLYDQGFIARADYDKAVQAKEAAAAQIETVKAQIKFITVQLGYTLIRSPVAGVVISVQIAVGQTVAASYLTPTLFIIAEDLKKMQIDSNLSEADVGFVKEKIPVEFNVDAFPGRKYKGIVRQIRLNPTNVQNVVTYDVVIDVNNPDLSLLPGMTTFAVLIEARHPNVLRVPNGALSFRLAGRKPDQVVNLNESTDNKAGNKTENKAGKETSAETTEDSPKTGDSPIKDEVTVAKAAIHSVYVLKDGQITRTFIRTGITDGKFTEVLAGELHEGDMVITDDLQPVTKSTPGKPGTIAGAKPL